MVGVNCAVRTRQPPPTARKVYRGRDSNPHGPQGQRIFLPLRLSPPVILDGL